MKYLIILFLLICDVSLWGQQISGTVFEMDSNLPIEYVNIGIVDKNIGTVSDQNGKYTLQINSEYINDTLRFSRVGYKSYSVKVSDFINLKNKNVALEKKQYDLTEVVVHPKKTKQKTLGITTRSNIVVACFNDSVNGSEIGILMKNNNTVFLKDVNVNISSCSYDTVFYRLNIYKTNGNMQFENILNNPIYVHSSKEEMKDRITIDLRQLNLEVKGDFLVTFEAVNYLGIGKFCFPASLFHKSYIRKISQGTWETLPVGISISVDVDIEK
jgi:hypothetical protein